MKIHLPWNYYKYSLPKKNLTPIIRALASKTTSGYCSGRGQFKLELEVL